MRKRYFMLLLGSLLLAGGLNARADWLGLMNSGNAIDNTGFTDSCNMDIGFDQNNNGISIIIQEDFFYRRVFFLIWIVRVINKRLGQAG